jgi:hypothetical protein
VSVTVEPDPPPDQRAAGYVIRDCLPSDNRQDIAIEVVEVLPVLLVDGESRSTSKNRGSDFLRDALSPAREPAPVVQMRVVPLREFGAAAVDGDLGLKSGTRPRVLILANVPRLSPEQQEIVTRFLAHGGGVLVALGDRVERSFYNDQLYRDGHGWLPAGLEAVAGNETEPGRAPSPLPASFFHPALELFRELPSGGLADARFPRWWKLTMSAKPANEDRGSVAVPVALLTNNDPLLVRSYRSGRVLLCTVALDNSWRTNLPELAAFAPLAHELVYYLAGTRAAEHNVQSGQPLVYRAAASEAPGSVSWQSPDGEARSVTASSWPLVYENTREAGVYRLTLADGGLVYYVVQSDPQESDLTPCDSVDRDNVAKYVPLTYENDLDATSLVLATPDLKRELWRWFMFGVIGLVLGEVWMTRRLAKRR